MQRRILIMPLMRYLREWPMNVDFIGIREESELEKLPPDEHQ
jgi:hypothetical protein